MNDNAFTAIQLTWGLPQSLMGYVIYRMNKECRHYEYHGVYVTVWHKNISMSLGKFVFLTDSPFAYHPEMRCKYTRDEMSERILVHEYGHTVQSLVLGPLYLIVIGIPSLTWGTLLPLIRLRRKKGISYFDFYCEKNANTLGEWATKRPSIGRVL